MVRAQWRRCGLRRSHEVQTWFGRSGRRRMQDPSLSQSRPFFGCFAGTLSPSCRRSPLSSDQWRTKARPLDPLDVHRPASLPKERRDASVAVAPIFRGERDDVRGQRVFIGPPVWHLPLGRPMLPEHATGEAFRDTELLPNVIDTGPAAGGAQKFPDAFARALGPVVRLRSPRKISFSRVRSDTAFRSR